MDRADENDYNSDGRDRNGQDSEGGWNRRGEGGAGKGSRPSWRQRDSESPVRAPDDEDRDGESDRDRDRDRDRSRRNERSRRSPVSRGSGRRAPAERRIYVSNIPYEYKWQDLKDLFRKEVGEVSYVEMFNDENNRPKGCAVIEFESHELVMKAVELMHRYDLKGRKLVVKEKADDLPLAHLAQMRMGTRLGGPRQDDYDRDRNRGGMMKSDMRGGRDFARGSDIGGPVNKWGNTYGLSTVFLESLGINGPLVSKVFVANLDYKVDDKMLREVFKIAGKVVNVEISKDQDGKSRGFGVVEFEHPVEAVQSISMLHNQIYYDRKMSVRMDRITEKQENTGSKLPPGLKGLGMGLGVNGSALTDIASPLQNTPQSSADLYTMPNTVNTGVAGNMPAVNPMATNMSSMGQSMNTGMGMMGMGGGGMENMGGGGGGGGMGNMGSGMNNMGGGMTGMNAGGMGSGMGTSMMPNMGTGMAGGMAGMGATNAMASTMGGGIGSAMGNSTFMNRSMSSSGAMGTMGSTTTSAAYGSYGGSTITRDYSHTGSGSSSNYVRNIIQLTNLPMDYTWQALRDLCREFGDIRFAEIRTKGTGTVRYQTEADARRAVEMLDRQRVDGRIVDVVLL